MGFTPNAESHYQLSVVAGKYCFIGGKAEYENEGNCDFCNKGRLEAKYIFNRNFLYNRNKGIFIRAGKYIRSERIERNTQLKVVNLTDKHI